MTGGCGERCTCRRLREKGSMRRGGGGRSSSRVIFMRGNFPGDSLILTRCSSAVNAYALRRAYAVFFSIVVFFEEGREYKGTCFCNELRGTAGFCSLYATEVHKKWSRLRCVYLTLEPTKSSEVHYSWVNVMTEFVTSDFHCSKFRHF